MSNRRRTNQLLASLLAIVLVATGCTGDATSSDAGVASTGSAVVVPSDDAAGLDEVDAVDSGLALAENQESHFDADDLEHDDPVVVTLDGSTASADSSAVSIDGSTVTLTEGGAYRLTGSLSDGEIVVDAPDTEDVTLVLDGVDITNTDGAAIAVMSADEVTVLLADGSTNSLTDGAAYAFPDAETDEPNAALYSASDLTISGTGELTVTGNYNDGIASKDGLVVASGSVTVTATDDGIRGKDYVIVDGGEVSIAAGGDGIKADNDEDAERGYVLVTDGLVDIASGDDGIQAATDVVVTGGELSVDAGVGAGGARGLQGDVMVLASGGTITVSAEDDAIHSNAAVTIDGGTLELASGDDGIHGDLLVTVNGGAISITEAFEGIEAEVIEINDGVIDITSHDDGLNVAAADATTVEPTDAVLQDAAATAEDIATTAQGPGGGRPGGGGPGGPGAEAVGEHYIYIHGGTISITITTELAEQGDGLDANGHVVMTGGLVTVSGATDTRNSALDYSGGSFTMTGGTLIGTNVDGRNSQGIGSGSTQAAMYISSASTIASGTVVHIESADGEGLVTYEPANDFSAIVFSSPDLVAGETYDVYLGGTVEGESTTGLYDGTEGGELVVSVIAEVPV